MVKRKQISPKMRFTILKRDGFTCKYCGKNGDETKLEIDHIIPLSKGGTNNIDNLLTSCYECNRGKSNSEIIENTEIISKSTQKTLQTPML